MDGLVAAVAQHGYFILFIIVFLEAIGLPVPAALALLVAGGASATGPLHPRFTLLAAVSAMMLGDGLMYLLGRSTGWWLLGILCRLSLNPEACILRSADSFYKRGRWVLIFAKFVPGINTMAPPLAGSMNMRLLQFLPLDFAGACLYTGAFFGTGYLFSGLLGAITKAYSAFGSVLGWAIALLVAGYIGYRATVWFKSRNLSPVPGLTPAEVARRRDSLTVIDVRSHGYYEKDAMRIEGSRRIEPNSLGQAAVDLPTDKHVVLYCTCIRDATSTSVARLLAEQGIHASVIVGGLSEWKKAGLPMERVPTEEMVALPTFS
jgi:membrane protein DedA with SNARE-associated domain/rhodanese-related sulfurtransferase